MMKGQWVGMFEGVPLFTRRRLARYCTEILNIPTSDLRRVRHFLSSDLMEVQLWNRRRIVVSGFDLISTHLHEVR